MVVVALHLPSLDQANFVHFSASGHVWKKNVRERTIGML
jgi:hypothetical protein